MADHTISETSLGDGRIRYELGEPNWRNGEIPGHPLSRRDRAGR